MRFEGRSEQDAIETALKELKRPASELRYHVVRDEKSFWGGRGVAIEVEAEGAAAGGAAPRAARGARRGPPRGRGARAPAQNDPRRSRRPGLRLRPLWRRPLRRRSRL